MFFTRPKFNLKVASDEICLIEVTRVEETTQYTRQMQGKTSWNSKWMPNKVVTFETVLVLGKKTFRFVFYVGKYAEWFYFFFYEVGLHLWTGIKTNMLAAIEKWRDCFTSDARCALLSNQDTFNKQTYAPQTCSWWIICREICFSSIFNNASGVLKVRFNTDGIKY